MAKVETVSWQGHFPDKVYKPCTGFPGRAKYIKKGGDRDEALKEGVVG